MVDVGSGIEIGSGITIGDAVAFTIYFVTEDNNFLITENDENLIGEQ